VSVSGVGKSAIELMLKGTFAPLPIRFSIAVVVNEVAVTTLTPFRNTSAVVPFHLTAILNSSVEVVTNVVAVDATIFCNAIRVPVEAFLNTRPSAAKGLVPVFTNNPFADVSLVKTRLFLKSTNQVPPLAVISPLVKMLPLLITSAFLVTEAELVGM
jgi:hypothetical protein